MREESNWARKWGAQQQPYEQSVYTLHIKLRYHVGNGSALVVFMTVLKPKAMRGPLRHTSREVCMGNSIYSYKGQL